MLLLNDHCFVINALMWYILDAQENTMGSLKISFTHFSMNFSMTLTLLRQGSLFLFLEWISYRWLIFPFKKYEKYFVLEKFLIKALPFLDQENNSVAFLGPTWFILMGNSLSRYLKLINQLNINLSHLCFRF